MTRVISRGVTGCGEAKTSASNTARTSAAGRTDAPSSPCLGSGESSNGPPSGGGRARQGRSRLRPHRPEYADGAEEAPLIHLDPLQTDQLEQGEERQDHARFGLLAREQLEELQRLSLAEHVQQ